MKSDVLELEVDTTAGKARGGNLHFLPFNRAVRGRLSLSALGFNKRALDMRNRLGVDEVPGQRIGFDSETGAFLYEPLNEPAHAELRRRIEKLGFSIPPERTTFATDAATFAYWAMRAVAAGFARVVKGTLPKQLPRDAKRTFYRPMPTPGADLKTELAAVREENRQLRDLVHQQGEQIAKLCAAAESMLQKGK